MASNPDRLEKLVQKAKLADPEKSINFVILNLRPVWMKCRRTKRLVFLFHKLGEQEGQTQCGQTLEEFQILPDRQENLVITQVNMLLGGLGLQVFFDVCPKCFGAINRCTPLDNKT